MSKKPDPAASPSADQAADAPPSFEEALGGLEEVVHQLEEGQLGLEQALGRYEEGVKLLRHCYGMLEGAERRIELLAGVDAQGNPVTRPFDDEASIAAENRAQGRSRKRSATGGTAPRVPPTLPNGAEIDDGGGSE